MYKKSRKDNIYTYWPRTFDLQNETLCPKALWVGGNTQIWGLFCGFVESVGCVPPLFCLCCSGFLLCKEFHPFVSIKKKSSIWVFFFCLLTTHRFWLFK